MIASITAVENRSAGNIVSFRVDESNFNKEGVRLVSKVLSLDGTVKTTDWGYPEGNIVISMSNVVLSKTNYNILIDMKEDDDYEFLFHYLNSTWKIVIEAAYGTLFNEDEILCSIDLSVIEKYTDGETT